MMNNYPYYPNTAMAQPFTQGRPTYMDVLSQQAQYLGMKGRPVASYDEAKASMIDFDGSIFYFPDAANQKIYTKQINLDGTSSLKTYALVEQPITQQIETPQISEELVSKKEFNSTIETLMNEIQKLKGAQTNEQQSSANDATTVIKQF